MKIVKFYEISEEKVLGAHFIVCDLVDKKKNSKYVAGQLFDGETIKSVNFFNQNRSDPRGMTVEIMESMGIVKDSIIETDIVKNGEYYNVDNWKLNTDPSITEDAFVKVAPIDLNEAYNFILNTVKEVDSNPEEQGQYKSLSYLTNRILESNKEAFISSSAAIRMHHNYKSGLLYHTYRMLEQALCLCNVYSYVDKELLVCGTVLHDIGKINCLETDACGKATVTPQGRLLDHAVVGIMMIQEESYKDCYDSEKIMMLQHMIASHHGKAEWGAITTPSFPEALLLHQIDMTDSRMNMFEENYKGVEPGTISNEYVSGLEKSNIYKPSYIK